MPNARSPSDRGSSETAEPQPRALIVDDLAENRALLASIVRSKGFVPLEAWTATQALAQLLTGHPDLILLDVVLPDEHGLDLLARIREQDERVPVVVLTSSDDPSLGERALDLGAVNFIRRPFDVRDIAFVVGRIRATIEERAEMRAALDRVRSRTTVLELNNDLAAIGPVVALLGREILTFYPDRRPPVTEIKLALYEAIANAIEHGNLEIGYAAKTAALATPRGLGTLIRERMDEAPYRDRRVRVRAEYGPTSATYRVRDEGPGFSRTAVERVRAGEPDTTTALHGRGLLLIKHYVDDVRWSRSGNEIRLVVHLPPIRREPCSEPPPVK